MNCKCGHPIEEHSVSGCLHHLEPNGKKFLVFDYCDCEIPEWEVKNLPEVKILDLKNSIEHAIALLEVIQDPRELVTEAIEILTKSLEERKDDTARNSRYLSCLSAKN